MQLQKFICSAYNFLLMIANEVIKNVRLRRGLKSKELAERAGISVSEVSLLEKQMRSPKTETLQRIAAALEVSTSFLLQEVNAGLPIEEALAKESLQIFLRDEKSQPEDVQWLREICEEPSAPQTVKGWQNLIANISAYKSRRLV